MLIPKINFPLYGIIIVLSVLVGMSYIYNSLKKEGITDRQVLLYFIMYISFAFVCGKMYTAIIYSKKNFFEAGLSAYGGLVGVIFASIIFEKILPSNKKIIKYTILSLPLVYGLTKIGCSIVGCCDGIPYEGILKIKYENGLDIWQFPIQIIEVLVFLTIFIICQKINSNHNINYIVILLVSFFKFVLDFFRYEHLKILISKNQIFSIMIIITTIIIYLKNKKDTEKI